MLVEIEESVLKRAQTEITNEFDLDGNSQGKCLMEAALDMADNYYRLNSYLSGRLREVEAEVAVQKPAPEYLRQMGSFYNTLADAWTYADNSNRQKLRNAYPEFFGAEQ